MRCLSVAIVAAGSLAGGATGAGAQEVTPSPWDRLEPGQSVRILTRDGVRHDGWIRRIEIDTMFLERSYEPDEAINLPAIDSLWVRRGRAAAGAVLGAIAFGIPTAAIGPEAACGDPGCDFNVGERVQFFLMGAAAGALIGVLIGSAVSSWQPFFP